MTYLLDTDHLSILQRQTGRDFDNLLTRMSLYPMSDFAVSVVTLHEQILGCHAFINKAQSTESVAKGYAMMMRLVNSLGLLPLIPFDTIAAATLDRLETQRLQLAKMDARIAAIALARGLTLLTRNQKDFCKVAGLAIEDWTL
ncbi:MAG: type II toxin-antitoxin system VapC family toxin [Synechococcaceae cyanobacterium SM2_3_60]|nr:type II toxin-antitoxin system VapC family toxin [Synechococcaceae cyanobacterium SM2_3_60]